MGDVQFAMVFILSAGCSCSSSPLYPAGRSLSASFPVPMHQLRAFALRRVPPLGPQHPQLLIRAGLRGACSRRWGCAGLLPSRLQRTLCGVCLGSWAGQPAHPSGDGRALAPALLPLLMRTLENRAPIWRQQPVPSSGMGSQGPYIPCVARLWVCSCCCRGLVLHCSSSLDGPKRPYSNGGTLGRSGSTFALHSALAPPGCLVRPLPEPRASLQP